MKPRQNQTRNRPNPLILANINHCKSSPSSSAVKNPPANVGDVNLIPGLERSPTWRRAWQPTPVFLPEESHGQRSLVGYSPCGHKESDMTEATEQAGVRSPLMCVPHFLPSCTHQWMRRLLPCLEYCEKHRSEQGWREGCTGTSCL